MKKNKGEKTLRKDKRFNQIAIRNELLRSIEENGYVPSEIEISKATGLSVQAISRHLKEMDFETDKDFYRMFTPEIVMNIRASSKTHPASQKLWMQIFEKWSERLEHTGKDGESLVTGIKVEIINGKK